MSFKIQPSEVAIVLPIYQDKVQDLELFAIRHLNRYLSCYPIHVAAPLGLAIPKQLADYSVEWFNSGYFASIGGYNRLLLSATFYERFANYRYILIYQLDALVFSDSLLEFCWQGWDYIGAPWFKSPNNPHKGFSGVGNGGLSLRHVSSFLRVLSSSMYSDSWRLKFLTAYRSNFRVDDENPVRRWMKRLNVALKARHGLPTYLENFSWNEDRFWSTRATIFDPDFRVAPIEIGLQFAFEQFPAYCFEVNQRRLPFGCHAWYRYDRDFWEAFLDYG